MIEDATLELHPGLTAVTGETGAGKTMVITGLHLLGGGRADSSRVRRGASRAIVEGRFVLPDGRPDPDDEDGARAPRRRRRGPRRRARPSTTTGRSSRRAPSPPTGARGRTSAGGRCPSRSSPTSPTRPSPSTASTRRCGCCARPSSARCSTGSPGRPPRRPSRATATPARGGGPRSPSSPSAASTPGRWPARPTCCATASPRSRRSTRSRARTRRSSPTPAGWPTWTTCAPRPSPRSPRSPGRPTAPATSRTPRPSSARPGAAIAGTEDPRLTALEPRLAEASTLLTDVAAELSGYLETLEADPERLAQVLERQAALKGLTRKYAADVDGVLAWARHRAGAAGDPGRLRRGAGRARRRGRPAGG